MSRQNLIYIRLYEGKGKPRGKLYLHTTIESHLVLRFAILHQTTLIENTWKESILTANIFSRVQIVPDPTLRDSHTVHLSFHGTDEKFVMRSIVLAFLENVASAGVLLRLLPGAVLAIICILPQPCECITQIKWRFSDLEH